MTFVNPVFQSCSPRVWGKLVYGLVTSNVFNSESSGTSSGSFCGSLVKKSELSFT